MENQPLHHQLYHLHHQVLSTLQLIGDSFLTTPVVCLQAGIHACLQNLQEQNGQLLHHGYSSNWKDLHQHYSSGQHMDNHVHQHGITSLIYHIHTHNRISSLIMLTTTINHQCFYHIHIHNTHHLFCSPSPLLQYSCHAPNSTSICMPMIMTKDHLYQKYSDALNAQHFTHAKLLSLTHFCKMFKGEHRHIKFPQFCILGQCNICESNHPYTHLP
jgi:hypothetical protein